MYEVHGQEVDCRCALCDKFFTDSVALNRHDKRVHGTIAEEPHCIDCELYFSRVSLYNRHNHEKHAMEPEFYCETCDKYFDGKFCIVYFYIRVPSKENSVRNISGKFWCGNIPPQFCINHMKYTNIETYPFLSTFNIREKEGKVRLFSLISI